MKTGKAQRDDVIGGAPRIYLLDFGSLIFPQILRNSS